MQQNSFNETQIFYGYGRNCGVSSGSLFQSRAEGKKFLDDNDGKAVTSSIGYNSRKASARSFDLNPTHRCPVHPSSGREGCIMNFADLVGQTLDSKYKIERQLGRGGMGTVYLATHLGTERPVAVKVIAPEYMERPEFVERFRREARAAGRLRHPNVVNVTDFGFAETADGRAAYLVMEYLDGCTLGEILEEEQNLPVSWTLDILEQVCSAVHAAHEQGIIHRDLKPDNIWLEPNQRGGYTVKVLDFGIAKLEDHRATDSAESIDISVAPNPTMLVGKGHATIADNPRGDTTIHDSAMPTRIFEASGVAQTDVSEARTAILPVATPAGDPDTIGTRLVSQDGFATNTGTSSEELTRVGAVIGTPLYMSPEQCRGERLDPRSDIYSLGVIAYQMLAGRTPFEGDFTHVMEAHKAIPPPPLDSKKVRKKLKRVIASALAKNPDDRPQTAEAFASVLRSRSEGIFGLLRRAAMIYSAHMPKFLGLSALFFMPVVILTASMTSINIARAAEALNPILIIALFVVNGSLLWVFSAFCAYMIVGTITWIVAQNLAIPLRPIRVRPALKEAKTKWRTFAWTGLLSTMMPAIAGGIVFAPVFGIVLVILGSIIGFGTIAGLVSAVAGGVAGGIAFFITGTWVMLVAAVIMMESKKGWQAVRRAGQLARRSFATALAAFLIMFVIPLVAASAISATVQLSAAAFSKESATTNTQPTDQNSIGPTAPTGQEQPASNDAEREPNYRYSIGTNRGVRLNNEEGEQEKDMGTRVKEAVLEMLTQLLLLPLQIIFTSFTAIISALLYIKTRQAGGESLGDLLDKFEESEHPRKRWQERVRQRLIQSGRITSRPSNEEISP